MTLVVHVVGLADLGINKSGSLPQEVAEHRMRHLQNLDSAARFISAFFDNDYPLPSGISSADDLKKIISAFPCPLTTTFRSLHAQNITDIELLIVGSKAGETPTAPLAQVIHDSLDRWIVEVSVRFGITLTLLPVCALESLNEESNFSTLENALSQASSEEVVLPVGGGANALVVTVAGTLNRIFPSSWRYIDLKSGGLLEAEFTDTPADPLKGWLLGLGLPSVAATLEAYSNDPQVLDAARDIRIALGEESIVDPSYEKRAKALGLLSLLDVARGDLASGMSIRAWITAEYQRRRIEEGLANDSKKQKKTLGTLIGDAKRSIESGTHPPHSEHWLVQQADLNDFGIAATHYFAPGMDAASIHLDEVHKALEVLQPNWLSWPNEHACLLYAQGWSEPSAEELRKRPPLPVSLMSEEPPAAVDLNFGTPRQRRLSVVVAASPNTTTVAEFAGEYIGGDEGSVCRHPAWTFKADDFHLLPYARGKNDTPDETRKYMEVLYAQALETLERLSPRPRVLIVGVTGEKPPMMTLLVAAQEFGARYGIPVFLSSLVQDDKQDEGLQFHQFGLDPRSRKALLVAANYCMDRFDFYTVARILAIGDSKMRAHARQAKALADSLIDAVRTRDIDAHAATILDALSAVRDQFASGHLPHDAQQRLATIVAELIPRPQSSGQILATDNEPHDIIGPIDQYPSRKLFRLLIETRDRLPLNHGQMSLSQVLEDVRFYSGQKRKARSTPLQFPNAEAPSYHALLALTVATSRSEHQSSHSSLATPGSWYQQYQDLRSAIDQMRQEASTPSVES